MYQTIFVILLYFHHFYAIIYDTIHPITVVYDIDIHDELGHDAMPSDCVYIAFDADNFPVYDGVEYDSSEKILIIFSVLQYCYQYNSIPTQHRM